MAKHFVERAGQLRTEQGHWESVRQQASAQLQELANRPDADAGLYTDDEQVRLQSQLSVALFNLQEIAQELEHLRQDQEAAAREAAALEHAQHEQELQKTDALRRESELKEQIAKEDQAKVEALQKEEQLKAAALEKDRDEKAFFAKKDSETLEALAKEERDKQALGEQERAQQEAQHQESDLNLLADIDEQWTYVQEEIASEWDYVDQQIQETMQYNVEQALAAVAEAGFQVGVALANPISQKEAREFLAAQKQELQNFIADEVFQAAPAEIKQLQLEHKFKEQVRAEEQEFGGRDDSWGMRKVAQGGLAELHGSLLEAVRQEQQIQDKVNAEVKELKTMEAQTKERLANANLDPKIHEEKAKQLEAFVKNEEEKRREQAEQARKALWETQQERMQDIEAEKRREAEREEARKQKEAEAVMRETFER